MITGKEILAVAAREVGYHESSGKKNKYGEWYGMNGVAWCMEFVQWVYHQCHADLPFKTPSCSGLLNWYKRNQPECVTKNPIEGCIVIFDFPNTAYDTDHTWLFTRIEGSKITTIDGNTSNGNDSNGGWVQQRTRKLSYANPTYIIPRGLVKSLPEEENIVKRYQSLDQIQQEAKWAYSAIKKLIDMKALGGTGSGLDLSEDMLRMFVINDRMGLYK